LRLDGMPTNQKKLKRFLSRELHSISLQRNPRFANVFYFYFLQMFFFIFYVLQMCTSGKKQAPKSFKIPAETSKYEKVKLNLKNSLKIDEIGVIKQFQDTWVIFPLKF
jgi:hypothetical protein